ncbi:MAG: DinB family protein [Vicinamibacterales bacterium]
MPTTVPPLTSIVHLLLVREVNDLIRELELLPEDLLWKTVPGVTNACGNLGLHIAGNLQHYVGAKLGATGYVRNREHEFAAKSGTRAEVIAGLKQTREMLDTVVPSLTDAALASPFPEAVGGVIPNTAVFLTHLAAHAAFHLGQAGYLRRVLTGETMSVNPVSVKGLEKL